MLRHLGLATVFWLGCAASLTAQETVPDEPPTDEPAMPPTADTLPPPVAAPGTVREPGYLGLITDDRRENGRGVRIVEIVAGGPGAAAGLEVGDLVTAINRMAIRDMTDVAHVVESSAAGDRLEMRIERDGQTLTKMVTLARRPARDARRFDQFGRIPEAPAAAPAAEVRRPWLGVRARDLTPEVQQTLNVAANDGAWVTEVVPDSPAAEAGLVADAVIVGFGGKLVDGPGTLGQLVAACNVQQPQRVDYYFQGQLRQTDVRLVEMQRPAELPLPTENPPAAEFTPGELPPPAGAQHAEALERRVAELEARLERIEGLLREMLSGPPEGAGPN